MPTLIALNSKSLTQKELAQHYHMTPRLVSKWVNQVRTTGYDVLISVENAPLISGGATFMTVVSSISNSVHTLTKFLSYDHAD